MGAEIDPTREAQMPDDIAPKRSGVERLKEASRALRGDLAAELAAGGTQVSEDGYNLLKFHGSYEQFDRDTATVLKQGGQEKDYSFMLRVRMPGGILTSAQYLALDELADRYGNATLRITTRQGIQFHGIIKSDLKPTIAAINHTLLTTQAACGDVVRNVTTSPAPVRDAVHARLVADARALSAALLPRSRAYHQIFLDADTGDAAEYEPLYGATYLPRKFKIGIAVPSDNTIDVLTNDLGLIAVYDAARMVGYNVAVGGGLGMTHNRADTYPRLASIIGSVGPDSLVAISEAVIRFQRDNGNRADRKRARLKYVLDDLGIEAVRDGIGREFGANLAAPLEMPPLEVPELLGWHAQGDGKWWLGVPVPSGRIGDGDGVALRTALRTIVRRFGADPIMTPQQDVLLSNIAPSDRAAVEAVLAASGVKRAEDYTPLGRWALACPALPTCGLALTEAERARDGIVDAFDALFAAHGLWDERVSLRITGCPNGCARSYAGDIGLVGRVPGAYAVYVGGDFAGTRLSFKLHERVKEGALTATLAPVVAAFAADRRAGEGFGDFCARIGRDGLLELGVAGPVA
jgi:sulfite reductase (ferredoxin)